MTSQSAKELLEELNKCRVEISKAKNELNEVDKEKESWFRKKEECSAKIKSSIQKIQENKTKRNSLTQEVKELKPKRDIINKEINEKLNNLNDLKKGAEDYSKSLNFKESPSRIRHSIEKLEFKIETEPMSFDKEQALMKKIRELKKFYESSSIIYEADKKLKDTSNSIRKMRKEANEAHALVQEKAKHSQILHEEILKISAEIDKMRIEEEEAFKKFSEFKKNFNEANSQLKEKISAMNYAKELLDKISADKKEKRRQEQESFLKSKEEEVNQKIKRREKLTTEDLLVFQKFERE